MLGRYHLHRRLGTGGFGTVWMARDERLDRDVAVKILPRERVVGGRFEREARAAARLSHPGIVTLYEAAVDDDGAYLVSELVHGTTLDGLLQAGRLSDRDVLRIAIALCDALAHAHSQEVVHRDVKPSNVLVPAHPATPEQVAKLTDFGVARVLGGDTLTRTGDVLGTAAYMAPEQAVGREAGPPADLYSLSLVIYEALAGVNPLRLPAGHTPARRLAMHLPPLRRYRRELPRGLARAIDLALRPRARERGGIDELREALCDAVALVPDSAGVIEAPWRPRWPNREDAGADPHTSSREWPRPQAWEPPPAEPEADRLPPAPWPARLAAAIAAGGLAAWLTAGLIARSPAAALVAATLVAAVVFAAPRLGWLLATAAAAGVLVLAGDPGAAMLLAPAMALPILLLPFSPRRWPLAIAAPALGVFGLAGAWPALAARAAGAWQRAALGALGWVWVLLSGAFTGHGVYTALPSAVPAPAVWTTSAHEAAREVLPVLLTPQLLAPALVWALGALILPGFTATRSARARVMLGLAWSLVVVLATVSVLALAHAPVGVAFGPASLGALAGALLAVLPYGLRRLA